MKCFRPIIRQNLVPGYRSARAVTTNNHVRHCPIDARLRAKCWGSSDPLGRYRDLSHGECEGASGNGPGASEEGRIGIC